MPIRILFLLILIHFYAVAAGQVITVVDAATTQPISNVLIYQEKGGWSISTNENGKANIDQAREGFLFFQHPSYREYAVLKEDLAPHYQITLTEKIVHIEEVVVSANRWEQDIDRVPQEIMSITRKTIEQNQPQTSADMLNATGQVFVQKSQLGGGSPVLRGFAANNVLLVIDGVRMNNAIYRSGNLQNVINIDPLALEGTEVIFGPGSVLYGSDALGGVMDFHTITPNFSAEKTVVNGQGLIRYSSANHEKTGHLHLTIGRPDFSIFSSISYNNFEDLRAGANFPDDYPDFGKNLFLVERRNNNDVVIPNPEPELQRPSGYNLFSTINKVRYKIKSFDFTYSFYYSTTNDIPRYDRLIETDESGLPVYAEWYYGPQQWMMNSWKVEHYSENLLFDRVKLVVANQNVEESRHDRRLNRDLLRNQYEEVGIWSANLDFDKKEGKNSFYYGFEALTNDVKSTAERVNIITDEIQDIQSRYPSAGSTWNSYSGYFSYAREIGKFDLNSGIRYSYITLQAKNDEDGIVGREDISIDNGSVTASLGAVYKPNENWRLRSHLSSGFRAPNVDDVGKIFEVSKNTLSVPNENLEPQYTYSAEVSASYINEKWLLDLTAYQTWVDNIMTRSPFELNGSEFITLEDGSVLRVMAVTNSGNAIIHGFTASIKHELSNNLGFINNITYTWGEEDDGTPVRHVPPVFGQWRLLYRKNSFNGSFFIDYHLTKQAEDIPLNQRLSKPHLFAPDGSTPGWFTLNFNTAWHFSKRYTLRINVENLLDRHYRPYSSGISRAGRNFIVSLSKTF